jgi:hypothetical protein
VFCRSLKFTIELSGRATQANSPLAVYQPFFHARPSSGCLLAFRVVPAAVRSDDRIRPLRPPTAASIGPGPVFAEAFEAIDANFRVGFQTLFGCGAGEMRLTDRENIAESGIDIVCSPPGKRLQNVLLLSGGEKALAAVALLMAIFKYQPSPFCVMDEVDAPLDEANIGRLTRLLKEMSVDTQFVVITHSKRTMEAAETLYGVTMQEPGVSRMVSVKFNATTEAAA